VRAWLERIATLPGYVPPPRSGDTETTAHRENRRGEW
jgi:hypothetical protein